MTDFRVAKWNQLARPVIILSGKMPYFHREIRAPVIAMGATGLNISPPTIREQVFSAEKVEHNDQQIMNGTLGHQIGRSVRPSMNIGGIRC